MVRIDLLCLGTGKASTHIYHGEPSTGFVLIQDGEPVLLMGAGLGIVRSCMHYCKQVPDTLYISHNHSDNAGELPLLLSVEAGKGRRKKVIAEPEVLQRILQHRLAEYHESIGLSNRKLSDLADFSESPEGVSTPITSCLSIVPYRSQHSERCFGFVLYYMDHQILGWSSDSGFEMNYYRQLATAPVLILDARQTGSYDHAGFAEVTDFELQLAQESDVQGEQRVALYVCAYGTQAEMPTTPQALRIGQTLVLLDDHQPSMPVVPAQTPTTDYSVPVNQQPVTPRGGIPHNTPQSYAQPHQPHASKQRARSPGPASLASPTSTRRGYGNDHAQQRSTDIKNLLSNITAESYFYDQQTAPSHHEHIDEKSYQYSLPGQKSTVPHSIKKFPLPTVGPKKIYVHNNECKGAPSKMFLVKNVRTLDQLKLKVAETMNIKPIKHLYQLDGSIVKNLEELTHTQELVATKHAGAPFDMADLPIHVRVGSAPQY